MSTENPIKAAVALVSAALFGWLAGYVELHLLIEIAYGVGPMLDEVYWRLLNSVPGPGAVNAALATMATVLLFGRRTVLSILGQHYLATLVGAFFAGTGSWGVGALAHGGMLWSWIGLYGWESRLTRKRRHRAELLDDR